MATPNLTGYQTYQKNKYETASPHKLILILYDGALRNLQKANNAIENKDIILANESLVKAQQILYELIACLNESKGGEIANNLKHLYLYMIEKLVQANVKKDIESINEVTDILTDIKSAWEQIGKEVSLGHQNSAF